MKYEKYSLILGCALFLCLFSNSYSENKHETAQKIVTYEKNFTSCIIRYTLNNYGKSEKGKEKEYVNISPTVESVFSSSGRFKRLDLVYKHERRGEITYRKISNGETYSNWHFDPFNVPGDATIEPATKNTDSMLPSRFFHPFTYYNGNKNDVTISVKDELVDLSWKDSETGLNIKGTYKLEGESYLPAEYIVTTVLPDGKEEITTRLYYEHEDASLKQITVYFPPHNIKKSYRIKEIEYNPTFPQDHFAITFRDGTDVFDKSLNARYRYEKSFSMEDYFNEDHLTKTDNNDTRKKGKEPDKLLPDALPSERELDKVVAVFERQSNDELKETTNHKALLKYLYAIVILAITLTIILVCKHFLTKPKGQQ